MVILAKSKSDGRQCLEQDVVSFNIKQLFFGKGYQGFTVFRCTLTLLVFWFKRDLFLNH